MACIDGQEVVQCTSRPRDQCKRDTAGKGASGENGVLKEEETEWRSSRMKWSVS